MKKFLFGFVLGIFATCTYHVRDVLKTTPNSREAEAYRTMAKGIRAAWSKSPENYTDEERLAVMAVRNRMY